MTDNIGEVPNMGVTVADETQSPFSLETTEATVDSTGPFVEVVQ